MKAVQFLARAVLAVVALAPWVWLVMFAALAVLATLHLGRLPRYNNPDPKDIAHLASLYGIANALLVPVALSPLAVSGCLAVRSFVSPNISNERWKLLAYGIGLCARCHGDLPRSAWSRRLVPGLGPWAPRTPAVRADQDINPTLTPQSLPAAQRDGRHT